MPVPATDAGALGTATDRPAELMIVLPARPESLAPLRDLTRRWLAGHIWPAAESDDLLLAVNEAAANAVEHAYSPGTDGRMHLHAWVATRTDAGVRRVVAVVTDRGSWDLAHPRPNQPHRGLGLVMMSNLMAETHVQRSNGGTTLVLTSPWVAAPPL